MRGLGKLGCSGRKLLAPGLIITTFVFAMFQGGFVSWFLFYSFLPFGLYALLLPRYGLQIKSIKRSTNQKEYGAGEPFSGTITIERRTSFPLLYLIIEDMLPEGLQRLQRTESAKVMLFPGWKRCLSFQYTFSSIPRGEHHFTSVRLKTGDVLGLTEQEETCILYDRFLVYPQYVDMTYRQLETRFEQGTTASSIHLERDANITIGVREYKPGDRFSWIDWKSSARRSQIMTKEFEQQQSHDVAVFMDRTPSPHFEHIVTFAASLVRAVLRKGAQLAFVSSGRERIHFPLRAGGSQQQEVFHHLAKVRDDSTFSFVQTSSTELQRLPQEVTCIIITGTLSGEVEQAAERMRGRHGTVIVFVVKEKAGQLSGQEHSILDSLKRRNIFVKAVYEGHYQDVFFEVGRS